MYYVQAYNIAIAARRSEAPVSPAAAAAVEVLVADITDRRGLKCEWDKIDADVVETIKATWGRIIDLARAPEARPRAIEYGCSQCGNLSFEMYSAHCADRNYHSEPFDLFVD